MKNINVEKIKTGVIVFLLLVIVFGASYFASELEKCDSNNTNNETSSNTSSKTNNEENNSSTTEISEDEQASLNDIDIDKYLELKEGSEASIIYIARPTCHYCQEEEPIIKNIVYEYDITVNYLNTDKLDDKGQSKLVKSDDYFSKGYGTPLLLVVKDDKIVDIIEGLSTKENIVNFFKEHGFINE